MIILHRGCVPNSSDFSEDMTTNAAAPSLILLALAAVIVPSFSNADRSLDIFSGLPRPGSSSVSTITGAPFLWGTSIGII